MVVRNEWRFSLLEMIDREQISRVKIAMILDGLEIYGKNPTNRYPYLYLLKRLVEEVEKRDWLARDDVLRKAFFYLKEGIIDRTFWDEERDRKIFENGVYGYFVESSDFKEMYEEFIKGIKRFKKEW